ncbi:MAG: hypothetical protein R2820_05870 [Cyclobacteriaceae bacterium]
MSEKDESSNLVSAGGYLTESELQEVRSILNAMNIRHVASGHGPAERGALGQYRNYYYEVKVYRDDYEVARKVILKRKNKIKVEGRQCPRCKSLVYLEAEKKGLWEKIYYYGTTLVQCKKCKTRYPI